jgi:DNA/RNA endonuclease YhcR with UshA esterase domain
MKLRILTGRRAVPLLLAAAALLAGCEPDTAPPFPVDEPGAVEGLLYFDADNDNTFDPSDGDYALQGVTVRFTVRGDTTQVYATGVSDAQGRLRVEGLPAGTADALFVESTLPAGVQVCSNPQPVTVLPGQTRFFRVETRNACLILADEVRELPVDAGARALVRGVVTLRQGAFRADNAYVQDASGGIQIFGVPAALALVEGDVVEAGGVVGEFNGEIQLEGLTSVRRVGTAEPIAPRLLTPEEFRSREFESDLVRLEDLKVVSVGTADPQGRFSVRVDPATGPETYAFDLRIEGTGTGLTPASFTVGSTYDVVGIASVFGGNAQLKPRKPQDVTPAS